MASSLNAGEVGVRLSLDARPLQDGAKKAERTLDELGRTIEGVGKEASGEFDKVEQSIKDVARTLDAQAEKMSQGFDEVVSSINGLSRSLKKAEEGTSRLAANNQRAARSFTDLGSSMTSIGSKMSLAVTAPMVATGIAAVKVANEFETAMSSITALVGLSADEVDGMSESVRNMAVEFGGSAVDAAQALYFVASAGIDSATAMEILESSLKASAIGMGQTMIIADATSSAINAYGKENLSAAEATDLMVASVREGKMEADALAGALPRVLPIASAMSVSFQEVGAAFAAMSRNGTDANEAATQIRGILAALLNPTKQAEEELNKLGLSSAGLRDTIREDGLLTALQVLNDAFGTNEEAAGIVFGNIRALTGVMSLFGSATESTSAIFDRLTDNTGAVDRAFEVMANTGAFKVKQSMAALKDSLIALGQAIIPVVLPAFKAITSALMTAGNVFSILPGPIKTVTVVLALLTAATGPFLIALGALMKALDVVRAKMVAFQSAIPWVLALTAAVAAATAVFAVFSGRAKAAQDRQEALTNALKAAGDPTATLVDRVSALVDEYNRLTGNDAAMGGLEGSAVSAADSFVVAQLSAQGLNEEILALGVPISDVTRSVESGTDWFAKFASEIRNGTSEATRNSTQMEDMATVLGEVGTTGNYVVDTLIAQYQQGKITGDTLYGIVTALDLLSDAFDDNREQMEADAQSQLANTENAQRYAQVLGSDVFNAIVANSLAYADAEGITGRYQYALQQVEGALAQVVGELRPTVDVTEELGRVAKGTATAFDVLTIAMAEGAATGEEAKASYLSVAEALGVGVQVAANDVALILLDAQNASFDLIDSFGELTGSSTGLEEAVRGTFRSMFDLVAEITNAGGSAADVLPTLHLMISNLYAAADAAGVDREQIRALIDELGILSNLDPEIRLFLTMDVADIQAQVATLTRMLGGVTPGGALEKRLLDQLKPLQEALDLIQSRSNRPRGGGGGGGGGGSAKQEDPFKWVEDWVKDLTGFTERLLSDDFADRLVSSSAPDIAEALAETLDEAMKLAVNILPGGEGLEALITATSEALQGLANQLEDTGTALDPIQGLRSQFRDAIAEVRRLEDAVTDLKDRFAEFNRVEVKGRLTAAEKLDQALAKYDQLKATLESLRASYEAFNAPQDPLEAQLEVFQRSKDAVAQLRDEMAGLDRMMSGPSPLEKERGRLDDMASALENLRSAQADYAKSTAQNLGSIPFAKRGGALGQAKRYLAKVEEFRNVITGLRDREFPLEIIRDVLSAGIDGGTALGKKLLSLSGADLAELQRVSQAIGAVTGDIGTIASDVLFNAEVSEAEQAFDRQMSLVRQMYAVALADAEATMATQKALTQALFEQQMAQAQAALEQQKVIVQALFKSAIAEAQKQLDAARKTAEKLGKEIENLEDAMRDLIKAIADAVKNATTNSGGGGSGSSSSGSGGSNTRPTGGTTSSGIPIVVGTNDQGRPTTGQVVGGPDRLWGGNGGGGVVDGVYIGPEVQFRAAGGPVGANSPFIVGELGPELFVPRSAGSVVSNGDLAGVGATNNYTINVTAAPGQDVGRQIVKAIQDYERRNGTAWRA